MPIEMFDNIELLRVSLKKSSKYFKRKEVKKANNNLFPALVISFKMKIKREPKNAIAIP